MNTSKDTSQPDQRPECACKGMPYPGAMCGKIIVRGNLCGHDGECDQQRPVKVYGLQGKHEGDE